MLPRRQEVSCDTCVGACCSNAKLGLTEAQAQKFRDAGTILHEKLPPLSHPDDWEHKSWGLEYWLRRKAVRALSDDPTARTAYNNILKELGPDEGLYVIQGKCGFLDENNQCSDYQNRPPACRNFVIGEWACTTLWDAAQVKQAEVPVNLTVKPKAS